MRGAGVDRAVLLPAAWDAMGNDLVVASARLFPERFAAFVTPDLRDAAGEQPPAWRDRGASGLRVMFPPGMRVSWLDDGTADWLWPAAAAARMPVMVWAPRQLDRVAAVAAANRRLNLVVDHLNLGMEPFTSASVVELDRVCALARLPNVAVKASALPCGEEEATLVLRRVVGAFGASRVFWGSDLGRMPCSYASAVATVANGDWTSNAADRALVLGAAFARWMDEVSQPA
jgi:predicted TIM-barrel fold metal-dependent hydrolase